MNAAWQTRLAVLGATLSEFSVRFSDDARADIAAAAGGTVAVPLVHLDVIRASGEEAGGFLHNLFSNDVKKLGPNDVQLNSFNTAKGRMLASFSMWREGGDYLLAMSADIQPAILKKLSMYVMRAKVKLLDGKGDTALIGLAGPRAGEVLNAVGLSVPAALNTTATAAGYTVVRLSAERFILVVPAGAAAEVWDGVVQGGATPAGTSAWTWLDVQAGVPLITAAVQEEFVPQWVNFELIGGVSFNKGCYPGQEIVARTHYLGKLKKRMYRVHVDAVEAPAVGSDLFAPDFGDQSAGKLVNVVPAQNGGFDALAVLQMSSAEAGDVHVGAPDGPALAVQTLPYALT